MSRLAPHISSSAVLMGYKAPIPLKIVMVVGLPMWILPTFAALFETYQYDVAALCFLLGGSLLLFIYSNNRGYRVAWDNQRIYMREWGFRNLLFQRKPFHSIDYAEMVSINGKFGNNFGTKSRFMSYEYLEITSSDPDEATIWIYPLSINTLDLADFLVNFHGKRPDIFPKIILDVMRKDGLIVPT